MSRILRRWDLVLFTVAYFAAGYVLCGIRRFWFDELLSCYLAQLGTPAKFWAALTSGVDNSPPLYYAVVVPITKVFGVTHLTMRLPALVGVWLACLSVYAFARRSTGSTLAWAAVFAALATPLGYYATEARPYGLWMASIGLSLVAWQNARPGRWVEVGLTLALAAGAASHLYAVLLWPVLAIAEWVRSREESLIRPGVWVAFVVGATPIFGAVPIARAAKTRLAASFWSAPDAYSLEDAYQQLLSGLAVAMVVTAGILVVARFRDFEELQESGDVAAIPRSHWVVVFGLLLVPAAAFLLAALVTNAFTTRYLLPATLGLGLLVGYVARVVLGGGHRWASLRIVLTMIAAAVIAPGRLVVREPFRFGLVALERPLKMVPDGIDTIVITNADMFLQLCFYLDRAARERIVFVRCGDNTAEILLDELGRFATIPVEPYVGFIRQNAGARLVVIGRFGDPFPEACTLSGFEFRVVNLKIDEFVGLVAIPKDPPITELPRDLSR